MMLSQLDLTLMILIDRGIKYTQLDSTSLAIIWLIFMHATTCSKHLTIHPFDPPPPRPQLISFPVYIYLTPFPENNTFLSLKEEQGHCVTVQHTRQLLAT